MDADEMSAVADVIRYTARTACDGKDRILMAYLIDRNLVADYEEWVGILNNDPERMQLLLFGDPR